MWNLENMENADRFQKWLINTGKIDQIYNYYGVNSIEIDMRIDEIIKWCQQHPNLPAYASQDRQYIENILRHNKYDLQRTMRKIEIYFQTIIKYGDFFRNLSIYHQSEENVISVSMPITTKDLERIIVFRINNKSNLINIDFDRALSTIAPAGFLNFHYGNYVAARIIVDCNHLTLQQMQQVSPISLATFIRIAEGMTSTRIAGIELINCPNYVNTILTFLKVILKPKLLSKFNVHQNLESLYKIIPKSYLPMDYGGDLTTVKHLLKQFDEIVDDSYEFFDKIKTFIPPTPIINDDNFGPQGNFRHLDID